MCSMRRFDWEAIRRDYEAGLTLRECQRRHGFSNGAWDAAVRRGDVAPRARRGGGRRTDTRERVRALLAEGCSQAAIARELNVSRSTVSHHARRLGVPVRSECGRRYDWEAIQRYYDAGNSKRACQARFGFASQTWHAAVERGDLTTRPARAPIERYLVRGRRVNRRHLKLRLLAEGLKREACERCGISTWLGQPLSLNLHHVNGDGDDNRLENLELLCPNCHSLTPNFSGRNRRLRALALAA